MSCVAAKVPARRVPQVMERVVELYRRERAGDEASAAFFARIGIDRVKALLADLETVSPESLQPDDFIDLGEATAFAPEVMEGECSA